MPAAAPATEALLAAKLAALGVRIRAQRKRHKVAAATAAEAAGMSRATLHRIERGEPSVTIGAYLGVIDALGLDFDIVDRQDRPPARRDAAATPAQIRIADYPQLARLAWQMHGVAELSPSEALSLYERNWRHIEQGEMQAKERALIEALVAAHGARRLLV